jgi:hypothetical protein
MKKSLILTLTALLFFQASAQVSVDLSLEQEQYLPAETVPVTVKITNRSGQPLHFGVDPKWLTFSVESMDGLVTTQKGDVPVTGEFDLESSQQATKHVDIEPYFGIDRLGRYKVTASLRVPGWGQTVVSEPKMFDVIDGVALWAQEFGIPMGANLPPETRKYTLQKANYLHTQMRLYVRVSDSTGAQVLKVTSLGMLVAFNQPEAKVDRVSHLHVLWQAGAQMFYYCKVSPNGTVEERETYDYVKSRPRLTVNSTGEVLVTGGVLRMHTEDIPMLHAPISAPAKPAPAKP